MGQNPIHILSDTIIDQFEIIHNKLDEIHPFGVLLKTNEEIETIGIVYDIADIKESIGQLRLKINSCINNDSNYHSGAYCYLAVLNENDVIRMSLLSKNSDGWIELYLPFTKNADGYYYGEFVEIDSKE